MFLIAVFDITRPRSLTAPREAEVVAGDGGVPAALALSFASPSPSDWSAFSPLSAPPAVFS